MLGTFSIAAMLLLAPKLESPESNVQAFFESRCLYCHSEARVKELRLRPSQWRKLVQRMQAQAPLLISRREIEPIVRYIVNDLKLVPKEPARAPAVAATSPRRSRETGSAERGAEKTSPPPPTLPPEPPDTTEVAPVEPEPEPNAPVPVAAVDLASPEDRQAEELGPVLLAQRCSKCHTLYRVFTKIDSLEAGEAIIDRMRKKTGSGISPDDARILRHFLGLRTER